MGRTNQEAVTTFAEVSHPRNVPYQQSHTVSDDYRLMVYLQRMKIYIPDGFQPDTLLKFLQTVKSYDKTFY